MLWTIPDGLHTSSMTIGDAMHGPLTGRKTGAINATSNWRGGILVKNISAVIGLSTLLLGCAGAQNSTTNDAYPPDYRDILVRNKASLFKDPDSIRDAMIATPKPNMFGWQSCLKANGRNGFGGYTGQTTYTVQFYRNGSPPIVQQPTIYDGCGSAYYEPFHEIEGGYVPPTPSTPKTDKPARTNGA